MNAQAASAPSRAPRGGSPFDPRVVLGLLLVGALAFVAALYFIGTGNAGMGENNGGGHAASTGLNGYAALGELLEQRGTQVDLIRNPSSLQSEGLLVLTPPASAEVEDINTILRERRFRGPTLVVLPKWSAMRVPSVPGVKTRKGWVVLLQAQQAGWPKDLFGDETVDVRIEDRSKGRPGWQGFGLSGSFADPKAVQTVSSGQLIQLVGDMHGQDLVSYWDDGKFYPALARPAGVARPRGPRQYRNTWPVVVVADPDLLNNYGMADRNRAMLALSLIDAARSGRNLPVAFDLTLNGLGGATNLLALAFTPPFLAATLCLIIAAIVVGWRAFRRFGPPLAETPPIAFGKRQLAINGANLIQRSRRLHLLGEPYTALVRVRLARKLGIRPGGDAQQTEAEIARLLEARGIMGFTEETEAMRQARSPHELLRRAHALKQIERTIEK